MTATDWPILIPLVVGHLALFILALNILHSTGVPDRVLDYLNLTLLGATLLALPVMFGAGHWSTWPLPARSYALVCLGVALVGLPTVTAIRAFRTTPGAVVATRRETIDLAKRLGSEAVIGEGKHNWILRIPGNWSFRVQRVEAELKLAHLPPALEGLSIVQISDTHFSPCYRQAFFEAVVDLMAGWEADLVVFTGDLLDDVATIPWVEPVFGRLRGRLGQFAILGNHDHNLRPGRARRSLRNAGFVDLDGRWTLLDRDPSAPRTGARIALGGTSEPWGPHLDPSAAPEADFRIVLSHSPDQFPRLAERGVEFVLAGHNHGGQVRVPGFGPILMPSRYSRHFDRGFFRRGESLLYVSQGVGGKHPIRVGCHPEVTRFTLRAARPATASSTPSRPGSATRPVADLV